MQKLKSFIQKHRKLIYLLAAAVIMIISCYFGFQNQENWTSERLGTTTDSYVEIKEDTEYSMTFKISDNDFQGVFLRFSGDVQNFSDETLIFSLYDEKTNDLIGQYTMKVAEEVFQSDSFVKIPCKESKDKKVILKFHGENISKRPRLYTSKNSNVESTFYIDGNKQSDVLVSNSAYMTTSDFNASAFISGGVWLLLLLVIYIWPYIYSKAEKETVKDERKILTSVREYIADHRLMTGMVALVLVYTILSVFVYKCYVENEIILYTENELVGEDNTKEDIVINRETNLFSAVFIAKENGLTTIRLKTKVDGNDKSAKIRVRVTDVKSNTCYHDSVESLKSIERSKGEWTITFDKEIKKSKDLEISVELEPIDFENASLMIKAHKLKGSVKCYSDGKVLALSPVLSVINHEEFFLRDLFIALSLLILVFLLTAFYLFYIKKAGIETAFVPLTLMLGIIYMLVIPVYSVPDEYTHMDTAYAISNEILGIEEPGIHGYMYKRSVDIETYQGPEYYIHNSDYRRIYNSLFEKTDDLSYGKCYAKSSIANAGVIYYLPAAIGITVARCLHLGALPLFIFGRLFSLIAFVAICYFAIKEIPFGKLGLFAYISTPIVLQEAASFSYDCLLNAIVLLFVSVCFKCIDKSMEIKKKDAALMLILMFLLASVKGGVYLPMCLLPLLIPIERKWGVKSLFKWLFVIGFISLISFSKNNIVGLIKRMFITQNTSINPFTGKEMYTFGFLIQNPGKTINVFFNTFFTDTSRYFYEFFGGKMGSISDVQMPWMYIIIFAVVIILSFFVKEKNNIVISKPSIAWIGFVSFCTIILINLSMLVANTSIKLDHISGVQGRYFIPVIILFGYIIQLLKSKSIDTTNEKKLLSVLYLNHVVFVMNIVMITVVK